MGGTDNTKYNGSLSRYVENGIFKNSGFDRTTAKFRLDQKINKKVSFNLTVNYAMTNRKGVGTSGDSGRFNMLAQILSARPTGGLKMTNEELLESAIDPEMLSTGESLAQVNPVKQAESVTNDKRAEMWSANAAVNWQIIKGLTFKTSGSYNTTNSRTDIFYRDGSKEAYRNGQKPYGRTQMGRDVRWTNTNTLTWKDKVKKHNYDVMLAHEVSFRSSEYLLGEAMDFPFDNLGNNNLGLGATPSKVNTDYYDKTLLSFFARANYNYDNRYLLTATVRTDGSTVFSNKNKWGFFPSASAAWVLNEEAFLKDVDWLSQLKLRAGYGLTGNQDAIEAYNSLALMSPNGVTSVNGNSTATYGFTRNSNPDLRWEVKKTFDVGVDAGILDGRFTLTADWYTSKTTDLLYKYAVPVPPFVYPELLANLGEMTNSGVELAVSGGIVKTKDFDFNMGVNFSYQKNKLNSLSGSYMGQELQAKQYMDLSSMSGAGFVGNNRVVYQMVGYPVGVFYIPRCLGLTPALDENGNAIEGRYIYNLDQTIDGKEGLDTNDGGDRYIAGQAMPKYYLGMNFSFRYKRFDLMTQMNGAFGHKIFNGTSLAYMNLSQFPTYNALAKAPESKIYDQSISDYWLEKGNYLNIDYITLGYNIDCKKIEKYVKNIRVTFSVNNVATITGYSGLSPMINSTTVDKDNNDLGMDNKRFYPLSRTYSLGLSVNF